jgi:tryptophanyl-tRNA synthetase
VRRISYPVLMAADILVYRATHVPVGEDQVQHLELTRDITDVFNRTFCRPNHPILVRPATVLRPDTKKIMSLCEPAKKMSKSEPKSESRILMSDSPDVIKKKISKATTDSFGTVEWTKLESRPGICNLIEIIAACENRPDLDVRKECDGMNMVKLKARVTEAVIATVDPIRIELEKFRKDRAHVMSVLAKGKDEAIEAAETTMIKVRDAMGFL